MRRRGKKEEDTKKRDREIRYDFVKIQRVYKWTKKKGREPLASKLLSCGDHAKAFTAAEWSCLEIRAFGKAPPFC